MNQVLALVQAARTSSDPASSLYSDHMLAELLVLNEEMIAQLRREVLRGLGSADFLATMIDHHEKTAAVLRTQLESHEGNIVHDGVSFIPREADSDREGSLTVRFTPAAEHRFSSEPWLRQA